MRPVWFIVFAAAILGGGALGWRDSSPPPALTQPRAASPPPASPARYKPDADLAWLARRDPWGARATPAPAPAPAAVAQPSVARPWRLGGVMTWGGDTIAIVLGGPGVAPEYRRIGENFPDGSRIVDIRSDGVTVELGGVRRVLRLTTPK